MTVAIGDPKTAEPYVGQFAELKAALPGHRLAWLRRLREDAIGRFSELGFATPKVEEWKFTNLAPLTGTVFTPPAEGAEAAAVSRESLAPFAIPEQTCHRLVFVNGRHRADLSDPGGLPAGVELTSLAMVLAEEPDLVRPHLGRVAELDGQALVALNAAFMADGAVLRLKPGAVLERPLHLLFLATGQRAPAVMHLRNVIVAERASDATIVESYAGPEGGRYWTNAVTEVVAAPDSVLRHYKLQHESHEAFHLAINQVHLAEGSSYESFVLSLGGRLSRNEIHAALDGARIECRLNGANLLRGRQHADNSTWIDHLKPGSRCSEIYKSVVDDDGHSVFQGKIIVRPDAQKTDAHQLNKTILLSRTAQAESKPELEIHADDVKCSHGAAAGELDREAMFYLRSRGLDEARARQLLIEAFVGELIDEIGAKAVRSHFEDVVSSWLASGETREGS
jgi:Fe-S cluster assembly protein SufD